MNSPKGKTEKPKEKIAAAFDAEFNGRENSTANFTDNRPEANAQKNLGLAANSSSQVKQMRLFKEMADNSEQQQKAQYFHEVANGQLPVVQRKEGTIQMGKGPVTDELRTPHKKWANSSNSVRDANKRRKRAENKKKNKEKKEQAMQEEQAKVRDALGRLNKASKLHIMVPKHKWGKVIAGFVDSDEAKGTMDDASWTKVEAIIMQAFQTGATAPYKPGKVAKANPPMKKSLQVAGETVEVTYIKLAAADGEEVIRISDAWVVS